MHTKNKAKEHKRFQFRMHDTSNKNKKIVLTQPNVSRRNEEKVTAIRFTVHGTHSHVYSKPSTLNFKRAIKNEQKKNKQKLPHPFMIFVRKRIYSVGSSPCFQLSVLGQSRLRTQ